MFLLTLPKSSITGLPGEIIVSILICIILIVLCVIVKIKSKKVDPLARPHGIMLIAEIFVSFIDKFVKDNMGPQFVKGFGPYIGYVCAFIFLAFISGLFGLPSPMTYLMVPLSFGLITFLMIHIVSAYYTHWAYFKRYTSPFFLFLPINLLSMWAPLISLSFRMFGNALSGWVIMEIVYGAFEILYTNLTQALFGVIIPLPLAVIITPALHVYFDLFSGFIQTTVFVFLTMLLIQAEVPDEVTQAYAQREKELSSKKSLSIK